MYKRLSKTKTRLKVNKSFLGETIEEKMRRILNNKEPIADGAPTLYTERKDGVNPETDIRTDKFEVAVEAMDAAHKGHLERRTQFIKSLEEQNDKNPGENGETPVNTGGDK